MNEFEPILLAGVGGILPALAWLWFWLREDSKNPEPRRIIGLAFLAGMVAVAVVIPLELFVSSLVSDQTLIFVIWAAIEELTKLAAAWLVALRRRENDEPIDAVIYMVTVALGFAAAENTLFLLSPVSGMSAAQTVLTGDYRFVGATLLHVLASATIGVALSLSFYKRRSKRLKYLLAGVILAIALHAVFNFLILNTGQQDLLRTFSFVWIGLVVLLALLEFVKRIRPRRV